MAHQGKALTTQAWYPESPGTQAKVEGEMTSQSYPLLMHIHAHTQLHT